MTTIVASGFTGSVSTGADYSGAAVGKTAVSSSAQVDKRELERAAPGCPHAKRGLRFYRARHGFWVAARGAQARHKVRAPRNCADARYLAALWRTRAAEQRRYTTWWLYSWEEWLPRNWYELGSCETGYGGDPNWQHSNSSYTSAFGISWAEYNADAAYMGAPPWHVRHTPRDQYMAALGHLARFGDGWGCPGP